jgi:hypothetical protein
MLSRTRCSLRKSYYQRMVSSFFLCCIWVFAVPAVAEAQNPQFNNLAASFPDGTSQTIAFADKYFAKCNSTSTLSQTHHLYD